MQRAAPAVLSRAESDRLTRGSTPRGWLHCYTGAFPMWLAPVQVHLVPVNDSVLPFVNEVALKMRSAGARVEVINGMSVGKAIRNAETSKIPVMCVVGAREAEAGTLAVRTYKDGELGSLSVQEVVDRVGAGITNRSDF